MQKWQRWLDAVQPEVISYVVASDAFDVLTSAALPYVEAFITERHQPAVISKTNRRDNFLDHLDALTLRDFRAGPPARAGWIRSSSRRFPADQ